MPETKTKRKEAIDMRPMDTYEVETVQIGELDVTITLEAHEEDTDPADSFEDAEDVDTVRRLFDTTPWGWCIIRCVAKIVGTSIKGSDVLGGCSYDSAQDFVNSKSKIVSPGGVVSYSGYYDDMRGESLDELKREIACYADIAKRAGIA